MLNEENSVLLRKCNQSNAIITQYSDSINILLNQIPDSLPNGVKIESNNYESNILILKKQLEVRNTLC